MTQWLITLAALVGLAIAGAPAAGVLVPRLGWVERVALSLWLGFAGVTLSLLLVGFVVHFSRLAALAAGLLTFAAGLAARFALGTASASAGEAPAGLFPGWIDRLVEWTALALVSVVLAQLMLVSFESYIFTYDFFATWGLDAKIFFLRHAVDFDGLRLARAYYPAAAPMGHMWFDLWLRGIGDRYISLPLAVQASALVVVTRMFLLRLGTSRSLAAVLTLFLCAGSGGFLFSATSGYGDLPLAAGLLLCVGGAAAWLRGVEGRWLALSGVGSGLAVWSKFEGLPSVALVALALLLAWIVRRGRRVSDLRGLAVWAGFVLLFAVPWYALVRVRHLEVGREHFSGIYFHPLWIVSHVAKALARPEDWGVWWIGAILLVLVTLPAWIRVGLWARWLALVVLLELVAVLSAYVFTVHAGDAGDLAATAQRLYFHWMPALVLVIGCGLQAALARPEQAPVVSRAGSQLSPFRATG